MQPKKQIPEESLDRELWTEEEIKAMDKRYEMEGENDGNTKEQ